MLSALSISLPLTLPRMFSGGPCPTTPRVTGHRRFGPYPRVGCRTPTGCDHHPVLPRPRGWLRWTRDTYWPRVDLGNHSDVAVTRPPLPGSLPRRHCASSWEGVQARDVGEPLSHSWETQARVKSLTGKVSSGPGMDLRLGMITVAKSSSS